MALQILAATLLLFVLWALFRFAMALRYSRLTRERARAEEESRGRRVVAEIPAAEGDLIFFLEDEERFYWGAKEARKADIRGARMLLSGAVIASFGRETLLAEPPAPEEYEGRERWDVLIDLGDGRVERVPCGTLREGVSREIAGAVFAAVKRAAKD